MKPDILIVNPLYPTAMDDLDAVFTVHRLWTAENPAAFVAAIADRVRGLATDSTSGAPAWLMAALPRLEIIACFGAGLENIDIAAAHARGITVANTPATAVDDVADLAIMLLIAVLRRFTVAERFLRQGEWLKQPMPLTAAVGGRRMGILGLGHIGRAVARRAEAFGMDVVYTGRSPKPDVPYRYYADLVEMTRDVDDLVVCCPGGEATRGLVSRQVLEALGPEGVIVNVGRGTIVDEAAMIDALRAGKLGGAGLDVFATEPHVPPALLAFDQVVVQPHMGGGTHDARAALGRLVVENLQAYFTTGAAVTPVEG